MPLICTPVTENTQTAVLRRLKRLKGKVDVAEVWLDQIGDLDIKSLIKHAPLPLLCVFKRPADGGKFKGSYEQMADRLTECVRSGAKYVDIPFGMPKALIKKVVKSDRKSPCKIIISYHDFKAAPNSLKLLKMAREMRDPESGSGGADIVKIAVAATSLDDCFTIITLAQRLQAEKIPHILIAMGKHGRLSRVLTPHLGGTLMFAPLSTRGATAPGQLTVKKLRGAWSLIV